MFPQLDLVTSNEIHLRDKVTYFASLNLFHGANIDEKQLKVIKTKINELLNSPISRCDGLLLFEAILQQHTPFYYENWHKIILANLNTENDVCQDVAYRILKLIMKPPASAFVHNIDTQVIPIFNLLISLDNSPSVAVECLCQCMRLFPEVVFKQKDTVQSFLIKQMDTNSTQICEAVADCMTVLPHCLVQPSTSKKVSKEVSSIFKKMLYTLQDILDSLINVDDMKDDYMDEDSCEKQETFDLPDMPDTEFGEVMMLTRIFSSLSISAAKFLCRENNVLEVPVLWILKLIDRVFTLTDAAQMCDSVDRRELIFLAYPVVQKGAFTILESLVQNFGLVQHTGSFISILKNSIKASYIATFTGGTNCQMRSTTWRILNIWLKRNGTQISIEAGNNKDLLRELFSDIAPEIDESLLVSNKRHQASAKKKSQHAAFPEPDDTCDFKKNQIVTCNEALKVLHEFVNSASPFLEEKFKTDIANQIFAVCHKIHRSVYPKKRLPFPYVNDKCRKSLYKIVVSLGASSEFNIKVLQQAFAILRIAERDKSYKINLLCRRANGIARHMLQPKKKFPEAVTNKKTIYESPMEEDIGSGWENVVVWNVNHANQENNVADSQIDIAENNASLSPDAHNSVEEEEEEIQTKFVSEREYSSTSKFDTSLNSSQSDSENESVMEQVTVDENNQESNGTPMEEDVGSGWENEVVWNVNHASQENNVANSQIDIPEKNSSLSPEAHNSVEEEEEIQTKFVPEREYSSTSTFDTSLNSSRSESENESVVEQVAVEETNHESNGTINKNPIVEVTESENINEATKTDDSNLVEQKINQNSCHQAKDSRTNTPTFDEMCADLVLSESSQLADS